MRAAVPVLLLALGTACGRDGGTEVPVPATVSVAPETVTLSALGASQALTATVRDQRGNVLTGQGVTWTSTNAAVASVNSSGVVTGQGNGTATIRATAGGVEGTATVTVAQAVAALVKASGDAQTGTVATALPIPLVVRANDANGHPVAGVAVTLGVTQGGGTLSAASQATGPSGETGGATWTLGTGAGAPQQVTASAAGVSPATFTATATAGLAARISLAAGDGQSAAAGAAVPISPSVLVQDGFDNPVPGVAVTFTITGGGGSVTGGNATTNASGIATVGSWTLGTTAGADNNTLAATSAGLTGSPVTFTASATPGAANQIAVGGGNNQTATVNTEVATAPSAVVRDQFGNPVQGAAVTFTVTGGSGSVTGANQSSDPAGVATVGSWQLGTTAGTNTLSATVPGLTPAVFTATGTADAANAIAANGGDNQTATVNTAVAVAPSVIVRDQFGNPVQGIAVTFTVTGGAGSVTGGNATTNASGIATVGSWTLGTTVGTGNNTLAAASGGLTGSPVTFTATGTPGAATQMALDAGNNQTATINAAVAIAPSVIVRDQFGNPVQGIAVTFTVTGGAGSVTGGNATTNASGIATVGSWTLGTTAGTANNTLAATSAGLTGSPVTFTASALAGAAASVAAQAGANQTGPSGLALPVDPAVIVRDGFANPVPGAIVTFAATQGGGSVTGAVDTTGANGVATVGDWILGAPGTNQLTATVTGSGIAGNPVTFTATATGGAGDTASVAVFAGDGQTGLVGFAVNVPPAVIVLDGTNAPLANVQVTFAVTGGGGQVTGGSVTTGPDGVARVGSWVLGAAAGTNTLSASVAAAGFAGNPVAFTATGATQQYDIEVRFLTAVTAAQQEAFDSAEARWERALYGELTDVTFNRGPGTCAGVQIPGVHETIDDLVIFVRLDSIDGPLNVLGSAGPCFIRGSDTITVMGAMQFDTADVAQFLDEGLFDEIVMHEMGHVIGFGTLWSLKDRLQDPVLFGGTDPHFDGPEAIAAFDRSGGADYSLGAKVPVEDIGGPGTADAHWRESVFDNELMTGFLNSGVTNPLSVVSVASLADVGYLRANYAAADPYALGGAALRAAPARRIPLGPDAYLGVVTFVDAQGRPRATVRLRPQSP